jgi:hypothetical protein
VLDLKSSVRLIIYQRDRILSSILPVESEEDL